MVLDRVRQLGVKISSALSGYEDIPSALPDIGLRELARSDVIGHLTHLNIAQAVARERKLPKQYGGTSGLGDPPITLYRDDSGRFYIEALLHSAASTAIHDHSFSGVFAVASGRCAHQVFDYETDDPAGDLSAGVLSERKSESLEVGVSRPIHNGTGLIHRNIHLDRPTVTVVIRTVWDGCSQHTYHQPGLALESNPSPTERKQLQLLSGLLKFDTATASSFLRQMLSAKPSAGQAFRCMDFYFKRSGNWDDLESVLESSRSLFGSRAPLVEDALIKARMPDPGLRRLLSQYQKS